MASPTAASITANGISAPTYADILTWLQQKFQSIYGADVYLRNDSQDGQFLAIIAQAISDANSATIAAYNAFSPATAQGNGLSSVVKINGIARAVSTNSQVDVVITGQAGTVITNGIVSDGTNKWNLPASVTIPSGGQITVTATCQAEGAITASPGTVTEIITPTLGWQSVTNTSAATTGAPVETDATLRVRQATSVAAPALTVLESLVGDVANIVGVTRYAAFENDTKTSDSNGIPGNTISLVVEGGDATAIATAIMKKKSPGTGTYGTTTETVTDAAGIPHPIKFFRPSDAAITVAISMKALAGYTSITGTAVQNAVADYINAVAIGGGAAGAVEWDGAITAAKSVPNANTFKISALTLNGPGGAGNPDVALQFNQAATCQASDVTLTVS